MSYRHFVYGMAHLARADARDTLRLGIGGRMAGAVEQDFKRMRRELLRRG